jgi:hypothetical protein
MQKFRSLIVTAEEQLMLREAGSEASDCRYGEQQVADSTWMDNDNRAIHRRQEDEPSVALV